MFNAHVNYFSLLIPLFLMVMSIGLFTLAFYQKISHYMTWLSVAIFVLVCVQILHTVILPENVYQYAVLTCLLFFIALVCTSHAVYLRLGIATHWPFVICILAFSEVLLAYFAFIQPNLDIRLLIVAITSLLLCCNNLSGLVRSKSLHLLDTLLKTSLYGIVMVILFRALYMQSMFNQFSWLEQRDFIWAITQFLMLFFVMVMITIFISCSIQDTLIRLSTERNLDPLTGLMNRRAFDEYVDKQQSQPKFKQHAIILCDIDHFKKVNDQYGHSVGDAALKHIAEILSKTVHKSDEIARIGGEEFLIFLPDADPSFAVSIAEQIRSTVANSPLFYQTRYIDLTLSAGVSFFSDFADFPQAQQQADLLLYQAKKRGRNQIQWQLQP